MVIRQKEAVEFLPLNLEQVKIPVISTPGTVTALTVFGVTMQKTVSWSGHYDVIIHGDNITGGHLAGESSDLVDDSEFPLLKRISPGTDYVTVAIQKGSFKTDDFIVQFSTGETIRDIYGGPITLGAGSYAKFSHDIVINLEQSMPNNKWLEGANLTTRANLGVFPHEALTGVTVIGLWPNGCKLMAITKRHCIGCGHYHITRNEAPVGRKVYFRNATNGPLVERTIIANINTLYDEDYSDGSGAPMPGGVVGIDFAIFLLDSDLPEDIHPIPVVGEWIMHPDIDTLAKTADVARQSFGIRLFSNDGEWNPGIAMSELSTVPWDKDNAFKKLNRNFNFDIAGISTLSYEWDLFLGLPEYGMQSPESLMKFSHRLRGGDSGSFAFVPVASGGWALTGQLQTTQMLKAGYDFMIAALDAKAVLAGAIGSPTNYTVTEATDPTL